MSTAHTAADLARAQAEWADAETAKEKCRATYDQLFGRLAEKQQALSVIQQRRVGCQEYESDGPTCALLALDIEALRPLVDRAQQQHETANEALQSAHAMVRFREKSHESAVAEAAAQALEARLHDLEAVLIKGLHELRGLKMTAQNKVFVFGTNLFVFDYRIRRFIALGALD